MKTCPNGHHIPDSAVFCPLCGAPVAPAEAPAPAAPAGGAPPPPPPPGYQGQPPYQHAYQQPPPHYPPQGYLTGFRGQVRKPSTVILLTIFTCGIYGLVWLYSVATEINAILGDDNATNPSYSWIGILCFIFSYILMVQIDTAMIEIDRRRGRYSESKILLWILLTVFVGIGLYLMQYDVQTRLNNLYEGR